MTKNIGATELEQIAQNYDEVSFIQTDKGKLVVFNPDIFLWNAYGKDNFDQADDLTKQQWREFMARNSKYFFLETEDFHYNEFDKYCKENKLGDYKND